MSACASADQVGEVSEDTPERNESDGVFAIPNPHPDLVVPGQEGRIDGHVWADGAFNSPEAKAEFCGSYDGDDAWFCSDMGQSKQAWTSAEYHGLKQGVKQTCYSPNGAAPSACIFPRNKHVRYLPIQTSTCTIPNDMTTTQWAAMLDAIVLGMTTWDHVTGDDQVVVVPDSPGVSAYLPVTPGCSETGECSGANACGGLISTGEMTDVSNLPVGPHGKDEGAAKSWNRGSIVINPQVLWTSIKAHCGGAAATPTQVRWYTQIVVAHEMGHVFGFDHFDLGNAKTNIMYPFGPNSCSGAWGIQAQYADALRIYSRASSGTNIQDVNLENLLPE